MIIINAHYIIKAQFQYFNRNNLAALFVRPRLVEPVLGVQSLYAYIYLYTQRLIIVIDDSTRYFWRSGLRARS